MRLGNSARAEDARAFLGKGTLGARTHAHAEGMPPSGRAASSAGGGSTPPVGRSGRGTGEMAGVVSATAPTDGQTVTTRVWFLCTNCTLVQLIRAQPRPSRPSGSGLGAPGPRRSRRCRARRPDPSHKRERVAWKDARAAPDTAPHTKTTRERGRARQLSYRAAHRHAPARPRGTANTQTGHASP